MSQGTTAQPTSKLTEDEITYLQLPIGSFQPHTLGLDPLRAVELDFDIPGMGSETPLDKLYWLLYTTSQIAAFFSSDRVDGESNDFEGWVYDELIYLDSEVSTPRTQGDLWDNDCVLAEYAGNCLDGTDLDSDNDSDGDLSVIRHYSYLRGIRATAALLKLFEQTVNTQTILAVITHRVVELDDCDFGVNNWCDFYGVGAFWYEDDFIWNIDSKQYLWNAGDARTDGRNVVPNWAWGKVVPRSGPIIYSLGIRDRDLDFLGLIGEDDDVAITDAGNRLIHIEVDMAGCLSGAAGAVFPHDNSGGFTAGRCGDFIDTNTTEDSVIEVDGGEGIARVTFRVLTASPPNSAPVANAGPDKAIYAGSLTFLTGTFTDEGDEDPATHTFLWQLDNANNGQEIADGSDEVFSFRPNKNGTYTFNFTVTDSRRGRRYR